MTIADVLSEYDKPEKKGIDYNEVITALSELGEEQKALPEFLYETLAFRLVPYHSENPWGTYYGPMYTLSAPNGNPKYSPALEEISVEVIDYWIKRICETSNPLLKMQYAGLVWDFETKIANRKHTNDVYTNYVNSMILVANGDYCKHFVITVNVLERLFELTKGNPSYLPSTKDAYKLFETRHAKDEHVRAWASQFLLMLEQKKCFSDEEKKDLVVEHEARLQRLSTLNATGHLNPWIIQSQVGLLAKYYSATKSTDDLKRVLNLEEWAFMNEKTEMSAMQLMGNLENIYQKYKHYHLKDDAERLSVGIQKIGAEAKMELQPAQMEIEIPHEIIDQADLMFGGKAKTDEERWMNFCVYFIPRVAEEKDSLEKLVEKFPLTYSTRSLFRMACLIYRIPLPKFKN